MNRAALENIEKALFVLCLDDEGFHYQDYTRLGNKYIHGNTANNRWFDKSFNIIVASNGYAAINVEHSWADAPVFGHCFELCMAREMRIPRYREDGLLTAESERKENMVSFRAERIPFEMTEALQADIEEAFQYAKHNIEDFHLVVRHHKVFGKNLIKKMKCSPDAFVQMALQLAFFRNQGHFVQTYESAMARLYLEGRTETIRSCTEESCALVKAILENTLPKAQQLKLLQKACERHARLTAFAMTGRGVDRHLFGLYVVSVGTNNPSPFLKRVMGRGWKLSTSQVAMHQSVGEWPNEKVNGDMYPRPSGGFGPVADDGYGVSYVICGEENLYFHVSSKRSCPKTDSDKMMNDIFQALADLAALYA